MPDYDSLANTLNDHPDFRVLRRLPIRSAYNAPDGRPIKLGLVLDTETTGLDPADRMIELAMIRFEFDPDSGAVYRILETFNELEDPGVPITESAMTIHGITPDQVKGKRFDDSAVKRVATGADLVIAHNARFDRPMVEKRYPLFAQLNWSCSYQEIDWKAQGFGSSSLEYLAYRHGFFYDAHGAEMDCRALLEIVQNQIKGRANHLGKLLASSVCIEERIWALNAPFERKDLLKERGYRWNSDNPKAWWISRDRKESRVERQWLLKNVYCANSANLRIDVIDASSRYSGRLTDSRVRKITTE